MRDTQPSCPSADIWFSTAKCCGCGVGSVMCLKNTYNTCQCGTPSRHAICTLVPQRQVVSAYVGIKLYLPGGRGDWELARLVEEIGRG